MDSPNPNPNSTVPSARVKKGKAQKAKTPNPNVVITSRRKWTDYEERTLMGLVKELLASGGWKGENGFRPGYLQKLEAQIREKLPGTDLRATPHIHSKITIWKRHHGALQAALGDSGGGFNTETKVIDVSDIAWEKALAKEPTVSSMRYKPWPFYNDWLEIFGNDGATGSTSQTVIDAVNELVFDDVVVENAASDEGGEPYKPCENGNCDMDVESQSPTIDPSKQQFAPTSSNKRVSRSPPGNNRELLDGFDVIFQSSDDRLASTIQSIVQEVVQSVPTRSVHPTCNRSDVFAILESIPDLTLDERLDACENILKNNQRFELFSGLPDHARPRYIRRLLLGDFD